MLYTRTDRMSERDFVLIRACVECNTGNAKQRIGASQSMREIGIYYVRSQLHYTQNTAILALSAKKPVDVHNDTNYILCFCLFTL